MTTIKKTLLLASILLCFNSTTTAAEGIKGSIGILESLPTPEMTMEEVYELIKSEEAFMAASEYSHDTDGCTGIADDEVLERYKEKVVKTEKAVKSTKLTIEISNLILNSPNASEEEKAEAKINKEKAEKALPKLEAYLKRYKAYVKACEENPLDDTK